MNVMYYPAIIYSIGCTVNKANVFLVKPGQAYLYSPNTFLNVSAISPSVQ